MMVATEETCNRDAICALAMLETREENAELKKRVAELEGLLGEAWPFLTRYPAIECLSQRIERALSPKDGE